MSGSSSSPRVLSAFVLAMIAISAILSMRNIPIMASQGLHALVYYGLAALTFLIPSALVCAELSTKIPENGGVYSWVKAAFGPNFGFLAIWMEWLNNVIAFPATLATIIATIAYLGMPGLASQRYLLFAGMMIILWGCTLYNLLGIKVSSRLNVIGALLGTLLPGVLIILLGIIWVVWGKPLHFLTVQHTATHWHWHDAAFFISVISSYAGMQVISFHAQNVKNPRRSFPVAIAIAAVAIFVVSSLAALSIAAVVPVQHLHFINGVIEGFSLFFKAWYLQWLTPVLALCIALGAVASLSAWIIAPARGLQHAAGEGYLPKRFSKVNKADMPVNILWLQAIIGTVLASLFIFMPSVKSAFWVLVALTSQFTALVYVLLFASAIRLRYRKAVVEKAYTIPGGLSVLWPLCVVAIAVCVLGFVAAILPPAQLHIVHMGWYVVGLVVADAVVLLAPLVLMRGRLE